MKTAGLLSILALSACVTAPPQAAGISVRQEASWPQMGMLADAQGNYSTGALGDRVPTVIVAGAENFDAALPAMAAFCGISADPAGWDTQFVYRDPASGDYWFDGLCG